MNSFYYYNHYKSQHKYKCLKCDDVFQSIIKVENHFTHCYNINTKNLNKNTNNNFMINLKDNININSENVNKLKDTKYKVEYKNDDNIKKEENKIINYSVKKLVKGNDMVDNKTKEYKEKANKIKIDAGTLKSIKKNNKYENKDYSFYYECYRDGSKFQTEKNYVKHFEKYHPDDYPFYCDECNKGFYSYNAIEDHIRKKGH